jgi:MOSC domain-containing protein YiiM
MPCFKLGGSGTVTIIQKFFASGTPGVYFRILKEGDVAAGDEIKMTKRDGHNVTVKNITKSNIEKTKMAVNIPALPESLRSFFLKRL